MRAKLQKYTDRLIRRGWAAGLPVTGIFILLACGCSLGSRHPEVQLAMEMLRVERDAAEDQFYDLKQEHDEALWKIEELETQLKGIQEAPSAKGVSHEWLEPLQDSQAGRQMGTTVAHVEAISLPSPDALNTGDSNGRFSEVKAIEIDPHLTRGFDSHGKSGDDGIVVALKPVDKQGDFLPIAAPVTVSLIDPARNGIRQRVGLWKFSAQQVANRLDSESSVFLFRLPWQRAAPIHPELKLFVRFQADDGKREAEMDFQAVLDGQPRSRWTPISGEKNVAAASDGHPPARLQLKQTVVGKSNDSEEEPPVDRIARPVWSPIR
ncbi:MAG: hypothetical protein VX768_11600 [Planctomycetota bacterium]|nr:hypothetical protein [Planctomycetota bacterium]